MSRFLQLHCLTAYPPSCCNRDDAGRPKTAVYGGVQRLRLSSQSLKRAVRMSDAMRSALEGRSGIRSRRFGEEVLRHLEAKGADRELARGTAARIASIFGRVDESSGDVGIAQLAFISPEERGAALELADRALEDRGIEGTAAELGRQVLRTADSSVDLALFGRMLADAPRYSRQAAVQVAHAITTHEAHAEDDSVAGVDDLPDPEDTGAGFLGVAGFGSGIFYLYAVVEITRLIGNLEGDRELAAVAASAFTRALATASPGGKRTAFAHNVRASYVRAEGGSVQPRSLACAFLDPVSGGGLLPASVERLRQAARSLDDAYGAAADDIAEMDVAAGDGTIDGMAGFAADQVRHG